MSEELLVNVTPLETRVAVLEQGILQGLHIERAAGRGIAGNIYRGTVERVLPGMQAAFVEFGEERTGFLHASDVYALDEAGFEQRSDNPEDIHKQLREGQTVVVQVTKDPLGSKGARLTTQISLSSRYLVYMPRTLHIGLSQQIESDEERSRLRSLLDAAREDLNIEGGFIVRTAAQGIARAELEGDLQYLKRLWHAVINSSSSSVPACLYEDRALYHRSIRDLARPGLERIRIDSRETYEQLNAFCADYVPDLVGLLEHYSDERPIFDLYGVEDEINRALDRQVSLKSGGYLVIDQTEAMTTIDVNTGAFIGRNSHGDTVFRTNLEAAAALARQLRVRNLGGIIIVDFIDMKDPEHQRQLLRTLEKSMSKDSVPHAISGISDLGLVEITRKRHRESLAQVLCEHCPSCEGRGLLKSAQTVCYEIFRAILRDARAYDTDSLMVLAAPEVVDRVLGEDSDAVADLEEFAGKSLQFRVEPQYSREQFDIILL